MLIAPFRATTCAIVGILMLPAGAGVGVDAQSIDVERSTLTVHVYKTGLFSVFADNHVIRAPIAGGRISEDGPLAVELTMKAGQMTVLDPGLSPDKRAEVQARMRGPEPSCAAMAACAARSPFGSASSASSRSASLAAPSRSKTNCASSSRSLAAKRPPDDDVLDRSGRTFVRRKASWSQRSLLMRPTKPLALHFLHWEFVRASLRRIRCSGLGYLGKGELSK